MKLSDEILDYEIGGGEYKLPGPLVLDDWGKRAAKLEAELDMYERDETFGTLAIQLTQLEAKNNEYHVALQNIADTSPNWMQKDAVEDSERRMRKLAQDALLTTGMEMKPSDDGELLEMEN